MNLTQQAINEIKKSQGATIPLIIRDLIKSNSADKLRMKTLWSEYLGNVPIKSSAKSTNPARPDNRLAHDFRGTIVQQIVGYMFGNPVQITLSEDATNNYTEAEKLLSNFLKRNYYEKLDSELETYLAVCGKGFRLLYYADVVDYLGNQNVEVIMKNIKPFEALVITDSTTDEPQYGMVYYQVEINNGAQKTFRYKVEFYDETNVYYFMEDSNGNYIADDTYGEAVQQHGFTVMPLVVFDNNTLKTGDFEKVRTLIDAYDRVVSFGVNDSESYAMAYLLFYGVEPTSQQISDARVTGAFYVPRDNDANANNEIKFLTKELNTTNLNDLTKLLNNDIFRFSACVDYSDEAFGGNQSGEARKYKLIPLETKSQEKQRLFQYGYQYIFKVVSSFWKQLKGVAVDYSSIDFTFTRSLPLDVSINDIIALQQAGIISTETAIEKLPFIDDSEAEYKKVTAEKEAATGNVFNLNNLSTNVTGSAA